MNRARDLPLTASAALTLHDVADMDAAIARTVARGRQEFDADERFLFAAIAMIDRYVTALRVLSTKYGLDQDVPEVDWRGMWGAHVVLTKVSWRIDHDTVWEIMVTEIPRTSALLRDYLDAARIYLAQHEVDTGRR